MCNSSPPSFSKPEEDTSQKSCQPKLSFLSERKQSAHPCRICRKPFVAQTATASSFPCRNTTRTLSSLPRKPRTSHFLSAGNSTTFCVPPHRVPITAARISRLFASIFFFASAYFRRLEISASRAFSASSSFFSPFFFSLPLLSFPLLDCAGVPKLCKIFFSVSCRKCGYFALFSDFLYFLYFLELVFRRIVADCVAYFVPPFPHNFVCWR